jgi:FkbM family methyltransferase
MQHIRLSAFCGYKRFGDRHRAKLARIPGLLRAYRAAYDVIKPRGEVVLNPHGVSLTMDAADDIMFPIIAAYGVHEPEETRLLESILSPGMTVLDIGANVGYFSVLASRAVGPTGKVFAFEPEPRNYELLRGNIAGNAARNVTPVACAVSNGTKPLRLYRDRGNFGAHTLNAMNIQTAANGYVDVPCITLDGFAEQYGIDGVDVVKMDVQGAEGQVFEGGEKLLRASNVKMLVEYWPEGLRNMGTHPLKLLERLRDWGFAVSIIDETGLAPVEDLCLVLERAVRTNYANVLFEKRPV